MRSIYLRQREEAHNAMLEHGAMPMRLPIDKHLALHESPNVYFLDISTEWPGPSVRLLVNGWPCDYWPCLTYERALDRAMEA